MSDRRLRELERAAAAGEESARLELIRQRIKLGELRDPRRDPKPGDVVRVAMHGANVERWDERRVCSCEEAQELNGRRASHFRLCFARYGGTCEELHWVRIDRSFVDLHWWGLARDSAGSMELLTSWRRWASKGEVVCVAESDDIA